MKAPQAAVAAYLEGNLNLTDLLIELGRRLAEEDACGLVASLPKDLLDELVQKLGDFPDTDEGWSRMRVFRMASWGRDMTREWVENEQWEEARLLRRGVELVRAGCGRTGGGGP